MALDKGAKMPAQAQNTDGETTPLLNDSDAIDRSDAASIDSSKSPKTTEPPSPDVTQPEEEKPFPFWQILILCYASIVEPMAFFIIFPYVNEMVERIGHQKPENVGFWTGSIESLFSIVQMLLIIFYGRLADRLGRKPVLVFSLAGIAAASALFGMSSSLPQMIVFRCTAGLFAGSSVTIRAMLSENCTKKTQGKAFAWFMFARYFYRSSQTRAITLTKCLDNLEFL
jgi:sugar phosphate permease